MRLTATDLFLAANLASVVAWDVVAAVTGWAPTISETLRGWGRIWPWLPAALAGAAVGLWLHLFYRR